MKTTIQVRISRGEAIGLHLKKEDLAVLGLAPHKTILATLELEAVA